MNPILGLLQTIVVMALMIFFVYKYADIRTKTTHFVCPLCHSSFKLSKFHFAFALKTGVVNERIVTCPVCGYKGRMTIMND
jgi:C4-type Zn-finger protein